MSYTIKTPADVIKNWTKYRPFVAKACAKDPTGQTTAGAIYSAIMHNRLALGTISKGDKLKGVFVYAVHASEQQLYIVSLACDGFLEETDSFDAYLQTLAKSLGLSSILMTSRPGFYKLLKPRGYKQRHIILEKRLDQ